MTAPLRAALVAAVVVTGCGDDGGGASPDAPPDGPIVPSEDWDRDILHTALTIDLTTRDAVARITLAPSSSTGASFEVGDLEITSVTDEAGAPLLHTVAAAQLDVGVPSSDEPVTLVITYRFQWHGGFMGADDSPLLTLTWPYYCGNVFPCKSRDNPADGTTFALELSGAPDNGTQAIYPAEIATDAPSYMLAWSVDTYTELPLGETTAGTEVSMWHLPNQAAAAARGGAHLVDAFDWLEQEIGAYRYGAKVGTVSTRWGLGAFGGMEHHPYWHIASSAIGDETVNAHEAAHGWFGNAVRLRCWEDFVLSEGTVTYLAARVLGEVGGTELGDAVWADYEAQLAELPDAVAWPTSCGGVDILDLFTRVPYVRGAYFYRAVADRIGADVLDDAFAAFYAEWAGQAAGMQDMLDAIEEVSGWDPTACADKWLRGETAPADRACP